MEFSITPATCRICLENKKESKLLNDPYPIKKLPKSLKQQLQCYWDVYKHLVELPDSSLSKLIRPPPSTTFFPERICKPCIAQLNTALSFRCKIAKSENVLKNLLELYGHQDSPTMEDENNSKNEQNSFELNQDKDRVDDTEEYSNKSDNLEGAENEDVISKTAEAIPTIDTEVKGKSPLFRGRPTMSQCEDCGKMIQTKYLKKHLVSHSEETKQNQYFPCDLCDRQFAFKENLSRHKRIHFNDKRYTCPYCKEKFMYKGSCKYHILSRHTGEKPYVCDICGKGFRHVSQKYIHIRQHTGVTPYACEICDRRFISLANLKRHQLSHTTAKDFHCDECGKPYKTKKSLLVHIRTLHQQERNYVCVVCSRAFSQNHVLRAHQLKNHPQYEPPPPGTIVSIRAIERLKEQSRTIITNVGYDHVDNISAEMNNLSNVQNNVTISTFFETHLDMNQ